MFDHAAIEEPKRCGKVDSSIHKVDLGAAAANESKVRTLSVRARRSERPCFPNRPFVTNGAKVSYEPKITDAAKLISGRFPTFILILTSFEQLEPLGMR